MNIAQSPRDRIKLWTIVHGKSQVDLAKMVGVSKQEIAHVGNGRYQDGKVVRDTAAAMGTTVDWLTKGLGQAPAWLEGMGSSPAVRQRVNPAYAQEAVADRLTEAARLLGLDPADLGRAVQGVTPAKKTVEQLEAEVAEKQRIIDGLVRRLAYDDQPQPESRPQFSRRIALPPRVPS